MAFCRNCGRELIRGVNKCGWCEEPLSLIEIENLKRSGFTDIEYNVTKQIIFVYLVLYWIFAMANVISLHSGESSSYYAGVLLGGIIFFYIAYYIFAPWAANIGEKYNRDPSMGFIVGGLFSIFGLIIYWVWVKITNYFWGNLYVK